MCFKKGKKAQKPPSLQTITEDSEPVITKAKEPVRLPSKQPAAKASSSSEKPQQLPLVQAKHAKAETVQPQSGSKVRPETEGKQSKEPPAKSAVQGSSKDKQPVSKPVYGNPTFYIIRIPVQRTAPFVRVLVYIAPCTMDHHFQNFFFKNIPDVDGYWGFTNYKAYVARRIVRLQTERKPTPYFLMVCRGECPKPKSQRNDNAIFHGMYEPIFNDAFVFKLGEPELYPDGYARYVHIEKDFDSIEWLGQAIRTAAGKVDHAWASEANPGFPDMRNYADEDTIRNDAQGLFFEMLTIRRAEAKYGFGIPRDTRSGQEDPEKLLVLIERMKEQADIWIAGHIISDEDSESADCQTVREFIGRITDSYKAIKEILAGADATANEDETLSSPTAVKEAVTKTTKSLEEACDIFRAARTAFRKVIKIARKNKVMELAVYGRDNPGPLRMTIEEFNMVERLTLASPR